MSTLTLGQAITRHGVDVHEHLDRDALIPVLTGRQRQGDVYFKPTRPSAKPGQPLPVDGVALVRGENGGHTHQLVSFDAVTWAPIVGGGTAASPDLGVITVPDGASAFIAHPEHGYLGIGPGAYLVRRQVQQSDVVRVVAD